MPSTDDVIPLEAKPHRLLFLANIVPEVDITPYHSDWCMEQARKKMELDQKFNFKSREEGEPLRTPAQKLADSFVGFKAEVAFARYANWLDWLPQQRGIDEEFVDYHHTTDVNGYEVRSTDREHGRLIIKPEYELPLKQNSPFVLVVSYKERPLHFRIAGWCWGFEGPVFCPVPWVLKKGSRFPPSYNVDQVHLRKF